MARINVAIADELNDCLLLFKGNAHQDLLVNLIEQYMNSTRLFQADVMVNWSRRCRLLKSLEQWRIKFYQGLMSVHFLVFVHVVEGITDSSPY